MRRRILPRPRPWGLLLALGLPATADGPHPLAAQTGRIEGTVELAPSLENARVRFRPYAAPGPGAVAPVDDSDSSGPMTVVIYLDSLPADVTTRQAPGHPVVHQRNQVFEPALLPIPLGSTVDFFNDDPIFHNVFSLSGTKTFDLGRYAQGQSKAVRFDQEGVVPVFCHIHSDMRAIILVLDTPYFTQPDAAGRFGLEGITPGEYTLVAWHNRVQPFRTRIRIGSAETLRVRLSLPMIEGGGP